jgi:predicted phosphodiesterase
MTRIVHLSDLHLGTARLSIGDRAARQNQRVTDFEHAGRAVMQHIVSEIKPAAIVIAGDVLDKFHLRTAALDGAISVFDIPHRAGIPVIAIGGNHDQPHSRGSKISLDILRRHGVEVYLDHGQVDIADLRLHLVPYRTLSRFYGGDDPALPTFDVAAEKANVLVAHGYAPGDGISYPPEPVEIPAEWLVDPAFALVCLGHIHLHAEIAPHVFYGGVIERNNFGEANIDPAFYVHELSPAGGLQSSATVRVADLGVANVPRPMFRRSINAAAKTLPELNREVHAIITSPQMQDALLMLTLLDVPAAFSRTRLQSEWNVVFAEHGGMHLELDFQTPRVKEVLDVKFASLPTDISDAFETFVRASDQFESENERLEVIDTGLELLAVARDHLASSEA